MRKLMQRGYMALVFLFLYLPILYLVFYSFNAGRSNVIFSGFTLQNYVDLFHDERIMRALVNTLVIALISAVVSTVLGTMAALGIRRMRRWERSTIMNISYIPVLNPDIITGVSMMLFFLLLGIKLGYGTVLIAHITFCTPYVILAVNPKLRQVDYSIYEAAQDLGAPPGKAFRRALLPQIMPGVFSGFLMALTLSVDDFVVTFFVLQGVEVDTLATIIYTMTKKRIPMTVNALCGLMVVAITVILLLANLPQLNRKKEKEEQRR